MTAHCEKGKYENLYYFIYFKLFSVNLMHVYCQIRGAGGSPPPRILSPLRPLSPYTLLFPSPFLSFPPHPSLPPFSPSSLSLLLTSLTSTSSSSLLLPPLPSILPPAPSPALPKS